MEHFIETVRKYPCLWNTTAIEYRDQELKDAAWAEVMKETDLSSGEPRCAPERGPHTPLARPRVASHVCVWRVVWRGVARRRSPPTGL